MTGGRPSGGAQAVEGGGGLVQVELRLLPICCGWLVGGGGGGCSVCGVCVGGGGGLGTQHSTKAASRTGQQIRGRVAWQWHSAQAHG
jgi:hypothetical protein